MDKQTVVYADNVIFFSTKKISVQSMKTWGKLKCTLRLTCERSQSEMATYSMISII